MKIIPLPNFYKRKELDAKMGKEKAKKKGIPEPEMPIMDSIEPTKQRTFAAVTAMGNRFTAKVKDEVDDLEKLALLKQGICDAVKLFISISFEKAEVNDLITNHPDFQPLQFCNPMAMFSSESDTLQATKIFSVMTNLQETVVKLAAKNDSQKTDATIDRLEKVTLP